MEADGTELWKAVTAAIGAVSGVAIAVLGYFAKVNRDAVIAANKKLETEKDAAHAEVLRERERNAQTQALISAREAATTMVFSQYEDLVRTLNEQLRAAAKKYEAQSVELMELRMRIAELEGGGNHGSR